MPIAAIAPSLISLGMLVGCGSGLTERSTARALFVSECGHDAIDPVADELVAFDWGGGVTPLNPDDDYPGLDLTAFTMAEGGTLADNAELFKERVRLQVTRIFCESSSLRVRIQGAANKAQPAGTIVFFTQALSPMGGLQVGEGEFDPCNQQHDNTAVVFGEQLHQLGGDNTFDDWVMIFANIAAHEIAHTLGYGHVDRERASRTAPSMFVELMLEGHTIGQLRREQRFVVEQTYCPLNPAARRRIADTTPFTCYAVENADGR